VHAAGVLADAVLDRLDQDALDRVLAPKVSGAWHLHTATLRLPLEFLVFFSSAAGVLGSPGQANYAAANAFLDTLAHYRRGLGLPATTIDWGPWAEVGLARRADRAAHVSSLGLAAIDTESGLRALDRVLVADPVTTMVLPVRGAQWRGLLAHAARVARFADLVPAHAGAPDSRVAGSLAPVLRAAAPPARRGLVEHYLAEQIAHRLGMDPATFDRDRPLRFLGLDSLAAMELRTRIERDLPVRVPVIKLLEGPSVAEFTTWLLAQLEQDSAGDVRDRAAAELLAGLDGLSDDEVDDLLSDLLAAEGDHSQ
jgi:hypothetical protein